MRSDLFPALFSRHAQAYEHRLDAVMARGEARGRERLLELVEAGPGMRVDHSAGHARVPRPVGGWIPPRIKSPSEVERLVSDARRANLNTLLVQVRKTGDAYFNRSDEPRAKEIKGPHDFDPLGYLIRLAHASSPRIEVHAWVNTFFAGQSSRVFVEHGGAWASRTDGGDTGGFLDPGVPEVQAYLHRIFIDLARNYDVDGIHLDFVRYPGMTWGYNPSALELYRKETGATRNPDPAADSWQAWRRDRVSAFVRDLHSDLKQQKPSAKLSAALICFGAGPLSAAAWTSTSAYSSVFQDWRGWILKGYLDFGVPMNYDSEWSTREQRWFDRWLAFEKDSGFADRVVVGVGVFLGLLTFPWAPTAGGGDLFLCLDVGVRHR